MRNLTPCRLVTALRARSRPLGPGDRGAVGVLVAVLFAGGVLLGIGALVIDTGQLYQNRAELQNGADAGALAIAKSCALGSTCTASRENTTAASYAKYNASALTGGTDGVKKVCGSGSLGSCPTSNGKLTDCPSAPSSGANYVDVHTETKTASGSRLLPPTLARSLLGNSKYAGTTVLACGQAEWGPPSSATTSAVTISECAFDNATNDGTSFAPTTSSSVPASDDQLINLEWSNSGTGCDFGWTSDTGNCEVTVNSSTYSGDAGDGNAHPSAACEQALSSAQSSRSPIYVPVFTDSQDFCNGNGPQLSAFVTPSVLSCNCGNPTMSYTLEGFAAFVLTGYNLPGFRADDWLDPSNTDNSGNGGDYITGYFTKGIIPSTGEIGGSSDLGAELIKLTG